MALPRAPLLRSVAVAWTLAACLAMPARAQQPRDQAASLDASVAAAESALRAGEFQIAESRYRAVLSDGWLIIGNLLAAEQKFEEARSAFDRAAASAVEDTAARQALAVVDLQLGRVEEAVNVLTQLAASHPKAMDIRRLLAQALVAQGHADEAVQELESAHTASPDDLEVAFLLASGYLKLKKIDAAERLFATLEAAKPGAETYLLIGRTYRDAAEYARARAALRKAIALNPRIRRAHYYLGTVDVLEQDVVKLDDAISEFTKELALAPSDPLANLCLGMSLVEQHRMEEALPPLQIAVEAPNASPQAFELLGRSQLSLGRAADAVASLRRALAMAAARAVDDPMLLRIHYQLGQALRAAGAAADADAEFAKARDLSASSTEGSRERLSQYLANLPDPQPAPASVGLMPDSPASHLPAAERAAIEKSIRSLMARAYLNLGIVHAQAQRFGRAAEFFEQAATVDADFPQVQYSLGVAYFNSHAYEKALAPLRRASAEDPTNADVRRMLAVAALNTEDYATAAELLAHDPQRDIDPSLQYAYGLALVRSNRADEAERVFSQLLAAHPDMAECLVVIGQAHAQQGEFPEAIESLTKAIAMKPDVADANAALGVIYLKQGRLPEAADALRAELKAHADDLQAQANLATVLDLQGHPDAALPLLRAVLKARPNYANARYLLGKILLAQGQAADAAAQLEVAVRLAPDEANAHYQLGQAYQKLGRGEQARQEFDLFQRLKDRRRGGSQ